MSYEATNGQVQDENFPTMQKQVDFMNWAVEEHQRAVQDKTELGALMLLTKAGDSPFCMSFHHVYTASMGGRYGLGDTPAVAVTSLWKQIITHRDMHGRAALLVHDGEQGRYLIWNDNEWFEGDPVVFGITAVGEGR